MAEPFFFTLASYPTLADLAVQIGARLEGDGGKTIRGLAPVESACSTDLAYYDNPRYLNVLRTTSACACLVKPAMLGLLPSGVAALVVENPLRAFAEIAARLFPQSLRSAPAFGPGVSPHAHVHVDARLENNVDIEPGAIIGAGAEIGSGTFISAHAIIGAGVRIGRGCFVGSGVSLCCALLGDRVTIHAGARIGQDGFGFAPGRRGHTKMPQIGRVIIQDDVEIGANSTVDRGSTRDTIIGEGAKIDNLVQIAHNVIIGRHCLIAAQVGVAGSVTIDDFAMIGGQTGIAGHVSIGAHAKLAAQSGVMRDVAAGAIVGGSPAQDLRVFLRQVARSRRAARSQGRRAS